MATQRAVQQDPNEEGNQESMYPGKGHQARPLGQGAGGEAFVDSVMSTSAQDHDSSTESNRAEIHLLVANVLQLERLLVTELLVQAFPCAHSHDYCVL